MKYPEYLVAIDERRNRVFVIARPNLIAVKKDDMWYYGEAPPDEEVDNHYELVTDLVKAKKWVVEARAELKLL